MASTHPLHELARLSSQKLAQEPLLVVLAAHPDDETVGATSLLLDAPRRVVIHLTDGAPHDRRLWPASQRGSGDRRSYARVRRAEAVAALGYAGLLPKGMLSFACADQSASRYLATLTRGFAQLLMTLQPQMLMTHSYEGGHPDNDAAAFVVASAVKLIRRRAAVAPAVLEMTSYHAVRDALAVGEFLPRALDHDHNHGYDDEVWTHELSRGERARKRSMLSAYASQHDVLAPFGVERERFRVAPSYDFKQPPHPGLLYYERMGWLLGSDWRKVAREALRQLGLSGDHDTERERPVQSEHP